MHTVTSGETVLNAHKRLREIHLGRMTVQLTSNGSSTSRNNPGRKNPTSNPGNKQKSDRLGRRISRWCAQCCRKKRTKLSKAHEKKKKFCRRLREKCKKREKKKKRRATFTTETETPVLTREDVIRETQIPSRWETEVIDEGKDLKKRKVKKKDLAEPSVIDVEDAMKRLPDVGIDFTKSCCYMCAKNTLAIAAAMTKVEKFHMSVQATTKELFMSDKGCSPEMHVRTVQSSVKVKMRDIGTLYPEKKRTKKAKTKLKLKNLNILPKLFPPQPKMRTVACETVKNNVPQCRGKHGNCVREANRTK